MCRGSNRGAVSAYAARGLARNPGFTAAAVFSLALGIGANTAVFSMFHSLMLRMLPVARPAELAESDRTGGWGRGFTSYPLYLEIRKRSDLFQGVLARSGVAKVRFRAGASDRLENVQREFASGNYSPSWAWAHPLAGSSPRPMTALRMPIRSWS